MTITQQGNKRIWEINTEIPDVSKPQYKEDLSRYNADEFKLFIKYNVDEIPRHSTLKYKLIRQQRADGEKIPMEARLFIGTTGQVGKFDKGSSRRGELLWERIVRAELTEPATVTKSPTQLFEEDCNKVLKHLAVDGLWEDFKEEVELKKALGYEIVKEMFDNRGCSRYINNKDFNEVFNKNNEDYEVLKQALIDKGREDMLPIFEKVCGGQVITPEYINQHTYFQNLSNLYLGKIIRDPYHIASGFEMLNRAKIKKMIFHKDSYAKHRTEEALNRIARAIDEKHNEYVSGDNGYDVSFEYNAEKNKAWYSEEYRGCGNGHYYITLNRTHALYCEKD